MAKQEFVKGYLTETDYKGNKISESVPLMLDISGKSVQVSSALKVYFKNLVLKSKDLKFKNKSVDAESDSGIRDGNGKRGIFYVEIFVKGDKGEKRIRNSVYYCFETDDFVRFQSSQGIPTYATSKGNFNINSFMNVG